MRRGILEDPSKQLLHRQMTARQPDNGGAVAGGGLTVIANAPNPAGYGILKTAFPDNTISPLGLLTSALAPTACAMVCLWFLPNL